MNVLRFLEPQCIELDLRVERGEVEEPTDKDRRREKEAVLERLSFVLERGGQVLNRTRLFKDLQLRESQASTAIAPRIAIPHARSKQVRSLTMAFARIAEPGVWFDSLDGGPTRLFLSLACPPWDDKVYLKVLSDFAGMIQHEWVVEALLAASAPQDVLNVLRGYVTQ